MLAGRLGVGVLIAVAAALLASGAGMAPLHAQTSGACQNGATAQQPGCYLHEAALVRGSTKDGANAVVPDALPPPEPTVGTTAPSGLGAIQNLAEIERHRSNQLTIIGWLLCIFLFAKGLEFAFNSAFKMEVEGEPDRLMPAAAITAIVVCVAAVICFVLLTLQARQGGTPTQSYGSLSECLHDAQTMDQIRECGTGDYSTR